MKEFDITVHRVLDGDTVLCEIDLGFGVILASKLVRIEHIDAPEIRSLDEQHKMHGLLAKTRLQRFLAQTNVVLVSEGKLDKFGRVLGDFQLPNGTLASSVMLNEYLAVQYDGKNKDNLMELHKRNWELISVA